MRQIHNFHELYTHNSDIYLNKLLLNKINQAPPVAVKEKVLCLHTLFVGCNFENKKVNEP